jgi:hypothetical protein
MYWLYGFMSGVNSEAAILTYPRSAPGRDETIFENDRERMFLSLGLILIPPVVLFAIGYGLYWAAAGFKPDSMDSTSRKEPFV